MCRFFASVSNRTKLYNPKYRANHGFFHPKTIPKSIPNLSNKQTGVIKSKRDVENYSHHVTKSRDKPEDLAQTVSMLLRDRPGARICVYASGSNIRQCLNSTGSLQRFPDRRAEQALMLRRFRKPQFAILMTDTDRGKMPSPDVVVHYDLPRSVDVLHKRHGHQCCNIFFYYSHEKVLLAHLQNAMKNVLQKWEMPSRTVLADAFLSNFANAVDSMPKLPVDIPFNNDYRTLGAMLYFAYRKSIHNKKHYLLLDPGFERFKTRHDVEQYLSDCGITNYSGISLTKKGFVVETMELLHHPIIHGSSGILPGLGRIKQRVNKGLIRSHKYREIAFNKLSRDHERKMIRLFKFQNQPGHHPTR